MIDKKKLRCLAEKATPGPWYVIQNGHGVARDPNGSVRYPPDNLCIASLNDMEYIDNANAENDSAYIAAISPDIVIGLLNEIERLDARVKVPS